ncbi:sodium:solute symporter family protein [Aspergillus foveolatus]|uniref:sodium:solute symporter family protein n=1 Tax=Aspergillus foveolatus TaxID=210207 RepID=UPI003CCE1983
MMLVTKVLKKTTGEDNKKTEMFMTANRTVRTSLTASAVISSWLWSAQLLGSSFTGYDYGVSGPFWFAAGCKAHTSLEVVRIRYGHTAHAVFLVLCLVNNIFASANMLLGASAVISAITGMHIIAATFLLPVGVTVYTFVGGIKATFLTDYFHTTVILIIACYFSVKSFQSDQIGSVGNLYELLKSAGQRHPVSGNQDGTYLTMTSRDGILFGILHTCSNFGLVIMDTSYFIKAFSALPKAVVPGYAIGGAMYFSIPWALGTVMSSVALGLENQPNFPSYPRRMTSSEVSGGLVLPYAAMTIAGKGGAAAVLLMIFMAVTSTLSAQVIAVSSILSFDVYREYFKRSATDRDVIRASHLGVIFFAAFCAGFSTMLHYFGVDLGWTLYMLGVVTCPGIFPMVFTVLWRRQNKAAAILSPILGLSTGLAVWLTTAGHFGGEVTVATTGQVLPCVYGTNYDWSDFKNEKLSLENLESDLTTVHHETSDSTAGSIEDAGVNSAAVKAQELKRWGRIAAFWAAATFLGHWVLWPLPIYGSHYVFGKGFYIAWVVVAIIWLWATTFVATLYPIFDGGYQQILQVYRGLRGRQPSTAIAISEGESADGSISDGAQGEQVKA